MTENRPRAVAALKAARRVTDDIRVRDAIDQLLRGDGWTPEIEKAWSRNLKGWFAECGEAGVEFSDLVRSIYE